MNDYPILGYGQSFSVRAGQTFEACVSTTEATYHASVRRIFSIDSSPRGPGIHIDQIASDITGEHPGKYQRSQVGSYAATSFKQVLDGPPDAITVSFAFFPTLLEHGCLQNIISPILSDYRVDLFTSGSELRLATDSVGEVLIADGLHTDTWYYTAIVISSEKVTIEISEMGPAERIWSRSIEHYSHSKETSLTALEIGKPKDIFTGYRGFNGKVAELWIASGYVSSDVLRAIRSGLEVDKALGPRVLSRWDFSDNSSESCVPNRVVGMPNIEFYNGVVRGVTGPQWDGSNTYSSAPSRQYDAMHLNDDMVTGGDWDVTISWRVPETTPSGIYSIHVSDSTSEDWIPVYVRPATLLSSSRVLFLAPTNTYLAYSNEHNATTEMGDDLASLKSDAIAPDPVDHLLNKRKDLGLSVYDWHRDGTGVRFASARRPLLHFRPFAQNWLNGSQRHFPADFYVVEALTQWGIDFDVATDHDIDREGAAALDAYDVVLTGSHPEYVSQRILDSLSYFRETGGRIMYLGGNGFYWSVASSHVFPGGFEMRRSYAGSRNFNSPPGEDDLFLTREKGGIWLHRGRSPHRLTGVGMGAMGWGEAQAYRRTEQSYAPEFSWVFDGVDAEEFGTSGLMLGGAAGDEMDHTDSNAGTPAETAVLASSFGHDDKFQPAIEYYTNIYPDIGSSKNSLVRSDMTLTDFGNRGAVFSTGSICWIGAMAIDNFDNHVARITKNVLHRFLDDSRTR